MVVNIRKAEISDANEILKLYQELQEFEMSLLDDELRDIQQNWEEKKNIKDVESMLSSNDLVFFLAIDGDEITGFVAGGLQKGTRCNEGILDIFVKEAHRGESIGTKLVDMTTGWFKERGCSAFMVNVYASNKEAKAFYRKIGMRQVGEWYKRII
jgi:ribosomal protein S18 acetylase RimI-like enzyme